MWIPTPIFAHFWEYPVGCQGTRKSLEVLGSKGRNSLIHTSVGSSSGAKRGSGEGIRRWGLVVFTEHLCARSCAQLWAKQRRGGGVRTLEPSISRLGWGCHVGATLIALLMLCPQLRGAAGGLSGVHERLQPGVLEGRGAEGLLPWLLGVPVLRYGVVGSHLALCTPAFGSPSAGSACIPLHLDHLRNQHSLPPGSGCSAEGPSLGLPRDVGVRDESRVLGT